MVFFSATLPMLGAALLADGARAEVLSTEDALSARVLGDPDAPLTIIEYSSLGCPHCKAFHRDTLPALKKEYIDAGKVKLEYRDYPLGTRALAASMIARCAPEARYFGMLELFFQKQAVWSQSENPIDELVRIAKFGGLSSTDVEACLQNQALLDGIRAMAQAGGDEHEITATPTFIVGPDERKIEGNQPIETFRAVLDKELN